MSLHSSPISLSRYSNPRSRSNDSISFGKINCNSSLNTSSNIPFQRMSYALRFFIHPVIDQSTELVSVRGSKKLACVCRVHKCRESIHKKKLKLFRSQIVDRIGKGGF